VLAAVVAAACLALAASASADPMSSTQAFNVIKALMAKEQKACNLTRTHLKDQGMTMTGAPWKATATIKTRKGSGPAVWMVATGSTTPENALAKTVSRGCR